ncbi:1-acyl-sn-glycerol-3-phosphate acyltransferase [Porifericola rhodea]|uniref:1-acyl-sn-glycerol-3-phosphate acyltransferase n=1 Tax=Porifericola rhodea TaxID=930972 RepID=UPI0026656849|nr:1-acyl-sn-glycerol-3-phosphate acyltransferase [Porifericola rhodea]WKN31339.1 1-acyl-sn-glycerol-3-phosphate acyltransferase [Porifericola rhodea]
MLRIIALIIFKITGWKAKSYIPKDIKKAVMVAGPHTSNWDFVYARAALYILRVPVKFTIKKEWVRFPLSLILNPLGAIPINRNPKGISRTSTVDKMVQLFDERDHLIILVTPEGTRKYAKKWKSGFYFTAQRANVPIVIGYLDYKEKEAGIGAVFQPTGDKEKDIEEIKKFYRTKTAKYPEQGVY